MKQQYLVSVELTRKDGMDQHYNRVMGLIFAHVIRPAIEAALSKIQRSNEEFGTGEYNLKIEVLP